MQGWSEGGGTALTKASVDAGWLREVVKADAEVQVDPFVHGML